MVPSEPPLDEDRFRQMLEEPERYGDIVGAALCKEHAELKPISVTLIEVEQKDFEREDRRAGKSPFDLEFLDTKMVRTVQMPGPVALSKSGRSVLDALTRPWMRIWFQNRPTTPIEITRIGPGLALRLNYAMVTPYIFIMWGDEGWLPRTLHGFPQCRASTSRPVHARLCGPARLWRLGQAHRRAGPIQLRFSCSSTEDSFRTARGTSLTLRGSTRALNVSAVPDLSSREKTSISPAVPPTWLQSVIRPEKMPAIWSSVSSETGSSGEPAPGCHRAQAHGHRPGTRHRPASSPPPA